MGYPRTEVRQALAAARSAGKDCTAMHVDARDTEITLEKWGFLPVDADAVDARMRDWYISQGLAVRLEDTPRSKPTTVEKQPAPSKLMGSPTEAAMVAAEAALTAAQAALSLARSMQPPAA